jgi:fructokinase
MPDIICLGEALVDMISTAPGLNLVQSPQFEKAAGGAPTNVAAGCAILGASAGLIAQVGKDACGEYLRQTLLDVGVDLRHFLVTPDHATQIAFVALDERGVPDFAFHVKRSADQMLEPKMLEAAYLREAHIFHFGSITLIGEPARSATLAALELALEEGLLVSLDPNIRAPLWPSMEQAYDTIREVIPHCDFLKVSEQEMTFLTGHEGLDDGAAALHDLGPEIVAVTRGPLGSIICDGENILEVPAFRVPVLDTTGCGDAFVAATLVGMLESATDIADMDLEELAEIFRFASAAAALTATAQGAIPALPGREEVAELLELGEMPMEAAEEGEG